VSVVRVRGRSRADLDALAKRVEHIGRDSALGLNALPEPVFYERQRHGTRALRGLVALTALLSGVAAAAGLGVLFSAAVHARRREIGLLRALGFGRWWVIEAVLAETVGVAMVGFAIGSAVAVLAAPLLGPALGAQLAAATTAGWGGRVPALEVGLADLVPAVALALGIGLAAGFGPAWRAARVRPAEVFRAP
jgi:putative ABC transport system permease protein